MDLYSEDSRTGDLRDATETVENGRAAMTLSATSGRVNQIMAADVAVERQRAELRALHADIATQARSEGSNPSLMLKEVRRALFALAA